MAPGSLCDINITGLYQPFGSLLPDDTVTLRFRAPGAADARDLTILATQPSFGGPPHQFTVLVPRDTPTGQAEILAGAASGKHFSTSVWIAASGFGIFTKAGAGFDAAVAQVWRDGPRVPGLTTPVQAGEWVTLWGTGLGAAAASTVAVKVAGISVAPGYAGPASGLPGVDQINFQFPVGVPDDCYVPVAVEVNGRVLNTPSIAAASAPGPCRHRLGLSADALATLDRGGRVELSQTWVHSDVIPSFSTPGRYNRYDTISLDLFLHDGASVQGITGLLTTPASDCQLSLASGAVGIWYDVMNGLDAGRPVVTGPGGVRLAMDGSFWHYYTTPSDASYTLDTLPPSSFGPGEWALRLPGGIDIATFQLALPIPPALRWSNRATVSPVSRASDLTLRWDPTGYTDRQWMQGSIGASGAFVSCQAPAMAGIITIPVSLIAQLPASTAMVTLLLTPTRRNPILYSLPLVKGGSFPGVFTFSYLEAITVELR